MFERLSGRLDFHPHRQLLRTEHKQLGVRPPVRTVNPLGLGRKLRTDDPAFLRRPGAVAATPGGQRRTDISRAGGQSPLRTEPGVPAECSHRAGSARPGEPGQRTEWHGAAQQAVAHGQKRPSSRQGGQTKRPQPDGQAESWLAGGTWRTSYRQISWKLKG